MHWNTAFQGCSSVFLDSLCELPWIVEDSHTLGMVSKSFGLDTSNYVLEIITKPPGMAILCASLRPNRQKADCQQKNMNSQWNTISFYVYVPMPRDMPLASLSLGQFHKHSCSLTHIDSNPFNSFKCFWLQWHMIGLTEIWQVSLRFTWLYTEAHSDSNGLTQLIQRVHAEGSRLMWCWGYWKQISRQLKAYRSMPCSENWKQHKTAHWRWS